MTIPVDLSQIRPLERHEVDPRVCRCGHPAVRHKEAGDREHGPCQIFSKGGMPRCGCDEWSPIGTSRTPKFWTRGDPMFSNRPTAGQMHPFIAALRAQAQFEWLEGQPVCDDCGDVITDEIRVDYLSETDRRTVIRHASC